MLAWYVENLISPSIAKAITMSTVRALADADPDAVARYDPVLVLASSGAARCRVSFAISLGSKARIATRVGDGRIDWRSGQRPKRSMTKIMKGPIRRASLLKCRTEEEDK
eukprot:1791729-Alexandrium_andersonii.AAC.1